MQVRTVGLPKYGKVEIVSSPQHFALDFRVRLVVRRNAADGNDAITCRDALRRRSSFRLDLQTAQRTNRNMCSRDDMHTTPLTHL